MGKPGIVLTHLVMVRFDTEKSSATSSLVINLGKLSFISYHLEKGGGWEIWRTEPAAVVKIKGQQEISIDLF